MNLPWEAQLALAAVIGFLAGLLVMWLALRKNKRQQQEYDALIQRFSQYRQNVDKHFTDTASAVDELNRSYQKVIQHLSSGAQSLMGTEALQEQLAKRSDKAVTVGYLAAGAAAAATVTADAATDMQEEIAAAPIPDMPMPPEAAVTPVPLDPVEQEPVSDAPVIPQAILERHEIEDVEGMAAPAPAEAATDADMEDDLRR
ncbi:MAG: DUF1043 family protein [Neisseria sp.]|nr:DUF1043 family protein [Neisseria sp.]